MTIIRIRHLSIIPGALMARKLMVDLFQVHNSCPADLSYLKTTSCEQFYSFGFPVKGGLGFLSPCLPNHPWRSPCRRNALFFEVVL